MTCKYLTFEDRKSFEVLYSARASPPDIAAELGIHLATVYRELTRGDTGVLDKNGRNGYEAQLAQKTVQESIKRRGHRKPVTA